MKKTVKSLVICLMAGALVTLLSGSAFFKGWRAGEAEWAYVQIPDNYNYKKAFDTAVDVLSEKYEMATVDKDERYVCTAWLFFRNAFGEEDKNSRSRVTLKFSRDGKRIAVKTEVQLLITHHWKDGYIESMNLQMCEKIKSALDNNF